MRNLYFLAPVLFGAAAIGLLLVFGNYQRPDIWQSERTTLSQDGNVQQSFVSEQPNLSGISIWGVNRTAPDDLKTLAQTVTLQLYNQAGNPVLAPNSLKLSVQEDGEWRFTFPPISNSKGKSYRLSIESRNDIGVWFSAVNRYAQGHLIIKGEPDNGDLSFKTYHTDTLPLMLADALQVVKLKWAALFSLFALLLLPGYALFLWTISGQEHSFMAALAYSAGLSVAFWPVCLLWMSVLGWRWRQSILLVLLLTILLSVLIYWLRAFMRREIKPIPKDNLPFNALALGLFSLIVWLRFMQIRGFLLPAWGDAVHHTHLAKHIIQTGAVPQRYGLFPEIGAFHHHFGFPSIAAAFALLSGFSASASVLWVGQVLNAFAALTAYLLIEDLLHSRWAALLGMFLAGILFPLPAFYLNWGRYTQLAGMALLPVAISLLLKTFTLPKHKGRYALLGGTAAAGLFLTHYRVTIFYLLFVAVYLGERLISAVWLKQKTALSAYFSLISLAFYAFLFSAPWTLKLIVWLSTPGSPLDGGLSGAPGYNALSPGLSDAPTMAFWGILAMVAAFSGLVFKDRAVILTLAWSGLIVLLANPGWLEKTPSWLLDNNSLVAAAYLPVAALVASYALIIRQDIPNELIAQRRRQLKPALAIVFIALSAWGVWFQLGFYRETGHFAAAADLEASRWIAENTSPDALFLINAAPWQAQTWRGTDGGYWLPTLANRRTTLPPAFYTFGPTFYVHRINRLAKLTAAGGDVNDPEFRRTLQAHKVTHVYIGTKGGRLYLPALIASPFFETIYSNGAVWVFEFQAD